MLSDAQSRQRSPTQRNECKERNDQTVSIVQCICDRNVLGCVDLGDDAVHQIDSERIESLACHPSITFCMCAVLRNRKGRLNTLRSSITGPSAPTLMRANWMAPIW